MCKKAAETAGALMTGLEPELQSLLTALNLANTTEGIAALTAYKTAAVALTNWTSGTVAQDVIEALDAFETVFDALPIPTAYVVYGNLILAGITTIIGIVTANSAVTTTSTAAVAEDEAATPEETTAMFQAHVASKTTAKVQTLVPGFERSLFHSPASQQKNQWNKAVDANPTLGISKV